MRSGRPPTLWCDLMVTLGPWNETDFDDVRIERALRQEIRAAQALGLALEDLDEGAADDLALLLRVGDAGEPLEEKRRCVDADQRNIEVAAEQLDDLFGLARAQQAVVDEDAGQLLAYRLVQEQRGDRGIDPAREAADHPRAADLVADARDRAPRGRRPSTSRRGSPRPGG